MVLRTLALFVLLMCVGPVAHTLEIVVYTSERKLYLMEGAWVVTKYTVAVGAQGKQWADTRTIHAKHWRPKWRRSPSHPVIPGGASNNPMGAAALTLDNRPNGYAIHGTNRPDLMGQAVSRGCIRMKNEDIVDLFSRVQVGTVVRVLK